MGEVVGALLPLALGVAISPAPVIAVILMLMTPRARPSSVAFLIGWILGLGAVVIAVALVVDPVDGSEESDPSMLVSSLKLLLGLVAVLLAALQWRRRPRPGTEPALPTWMAAVDTMTVGRAGGLGALLAGVNPKNLTLCLTGGVTIGSGGLTPGQAAAASALFVAIGSSTVAVPVIGNLIAPAQLRGALEDLRAWLTTNNSVVMTVLMLVIGVTTIGDAVAGF